MGFIFLFLSGMKTTIKALYNIFLKYPNITTDSRQVCPNSIFFALKGENFNGNDFASDAIDKGAKLVVIDEVKNKPDNRFFVVKDVLTTLQQLATFHRKNLNLQVIGITGTNGKTTTKELIQLVLLKRYKSKATEGNFNNHIGVPLTILSLSTDHDFAVIEMGANHIGEIALLCEIARPDFGIITNIGKAHLEGFGGLKGVIKAKSELYDYIRQNNGKIFINTDNEILTEIGDGIKPITYGTGEKCFCTATLIESFPFLNLKYQVGINSYFIKSKLTGTYNFENILATICIGSYFKVEPEDIKEAIESYEPKNNRSQLITTSKNKVILDAYNANPTSMKVAIENISQNPYKNKILILGDMAELGTESEKEHANILKLIDKTKFQNVFLVGDNFYSVAKNRGYKCFSSASNLIDYLRTKAIENSTILLKASRRIQLETIVDVL